MSKLKCPLCEAGIAPTSLDKSKRVIHKRVIVFERREDSIVYVCPIHGIRTLLYESLTDEERNMLMVR